MYEMYPRVAIRYSENTKSITLTFIATESTGHPKREVSIKGSSNIIPNINKEKTAWGQQFY
jgi:hypothetical protein